MTDLLRLARKISGVKSTVLIIGETGSGKELVAHYIHECGSRKDKSFIAVNCGAIPENLAESGFFGYEEEAFTGAQKGGRAGLIEAANGGTLFLDEVGELSLNVQVKLLRALRSKTITRVGGTKTLFIDVRIISATNRDLEKQVEDGHFRESLYYRLNVVPLKVPP